MKQFILTCLAILYLFCVPVKVYSQPTINEQLKDLLGTIMPPPEMAPFFYDFTAHESDDIWFKALNFDDTIDLNTWWTIYYEMQHSSRIPNFIPETFSLKYNAAQITKKDTIPIGIMDMEYNRLKPDAWDSGVYFGWDDMNIWDIPGRPDHPYLLNTDMPARQARLDLFAASPLHDVSEFTNVTFQINPAFSFYSAPYNSQTQLPPTHDVKINFGDGGGFHSINPSMISYWEIEYPAEGLYYIEVMVEAGDVTIRYSRSSFLVQTNRSSIVPDDFITTIDGITAGVYYACDTQPTLNKVLIAVSGFDAFESHNVPDIYDQLINQPQLIMLRNYGYDIVCVDWTDSKEDLRINADRLIALIEHLKCNVELVDHNFTIVGISMGALISNYALTKMETQAYYQQALLDTSICFPEQSHNVRTFISLEGEYQGAFVNVGAMRLAKEYSNELYVSNLPSFMMNDMQISADFLYNGLLQRIGVQQMVKYHIDSTDGMNHYFEHPERVTFLEDLASMGNHPRYCKIIALSNALADGKNQVAIGNREAEVGDYYFDFSLYAQVDILGIRTARGELDFRLRTHPDGNQYHHPVFPLVQGSVMDYHLDIPHTINIKGCLIQFLNKILFPIPNNAPPCVTNHDRDVHFKMNDTIPWDILPGGRISSASTIFSQNSGSYLGRKGKSPWLVFPHSISYNIDSTTGNVVAYAFARSTTLGFRTAGGYSVASLHSDLEGFNFVPWQSALDYQRADSLKQDLLNTPIDSNLARTPFDVMISMPPHAGFPRTWSDPNRGQKHFDHREMRADEVDTALSLTLITREIGETYMHLDNQIINRRSWFEAEHEINVGKNSSPHWIYSNVSPSNRLDATWSKDSGFFIVGSKADVQLKAGHEIRLKPGFEVRDSGQLIAKIEPMAVCNYSLEDLRELYPAPEAYRDLSQITDPDKEIPHFSLYPNPAEELLYIRQDMPGHASYRLLNVWGGLVGSGSLSEGLNSINFGFLPGGMYIVHIFGDNLSLNYKIMKK